MSEHSGKVCPQSRPGTEPYWQACKRHEFLIQCCKECGHYQFYPRIICTSCSSRKVEWVPASGGGAVLTWTVVRRAVSNAYAADVPYIIALIKLHEGPVLMSIIRGCEPESVRAGMAVEVSFENWSDQVSMPVFVTASG